MSIYYKLLLNYLPTPDFFKLFFLKRLFNLHTFIYTFAECKIAKLNLFVNLNKLKFTNFRKFKICWDKFHQKKECFSNSKDSIELSISK